MDKLHLGAAYHGNRMPHHAYEDFKDMVGHGMDTVVHMLSHTDWTRHLEVMKDLVAASEEAGLEVWMDNWGLGGSPGDTSFFLALHPEAHMIFSDGSMDAKHPCVRSQAYRQFTKEWIDAVYYTGARTVFWDEPHAPTKKTDGGLIHCCACPACKKLFLEKYGREMPLYADADTADFAAESIADYFAEVTAYAHEKGMKNVVCVMIGTYGMSMDQADKILTLPYVENLGGDPYWDGRKRQNPELDVYAFVRSEAEKHLDLCQKYKKEHNVWLQSYSFERGSEEDIIDAADAIYDAGARTILAWGYYGSESNTYRAKNAYRTWTNVCEAYQRILNRDRDARVAEARARYEANCPAKKN